MKTRMLVSILLFVWAVMTFAGNCATSKKVYVAKEDEELYGTLMYPDYDDSQHAATFVLNPDGTFEAYAKTDTTHHPYYLGEYVITDK